MTKPFFEERSEASMIKATIVQKYFEVWAHIMLSKAPSHSRSHYSKKIAYVDLYAGRGRYQDGEASTPLLVIEKAIKTPMIAEALVTLFNDQDKNNTELLKTEINKLPGIEALKHPPVVMQNTVGDDAANYFKKTRGIPTFTFLDPFGYKGLSLDLVNEFIKDWGCDCLFFFNYNRINAGLGNPTVKAHMDALFGKEWAAKLRKKAFGAKPYQREKMVLEAMSKALQDMRGNFVLPFSFHNENGRLTHHLIFVSKNFTGYEAMKKIMAKASTISDQGIASFAHTPADKAMPLLFESPQPFNDLKGMLLTGYAGKKLTMDEIYRQHSVNRPYLSKNYKDVLGCLHECGAITVENPKGKPHRKGTFADHLIVSFPKEVI